MSEQKLERIENKLDRLVDQQGEIGVHIAEIKKDLKYHIKRTDLLEADVKPIKKHVSNVHAILKLVGMLSLLAGVAEGVVITLEYIKKLG